MKSTVELHGYKGLRLSGRQGFTCPGYEPADPHTHSSLASMIQGGTAPNKVWGKDFAVLAMQ